MPQIINTNIASLNAQRNLNKSQSANQTSLQRLSSGLRINSAKDDAAGLAISTRFNSQIRGLNVAVRNAGDGISLAQTAEGALGSMNDNLQRVRELAVQSANATNSDVDRDALQAEVSQLLAEVSRTAEETDFNGRKLLDGSFEATFQIGANSGQTLDISIAELTADKLGVGTSSGVSAQGDAAALQNGDLIINGVAIDPSTAESDSYSTVDASSSAIAKVDAINAKSDQTGVSAVVNTNVSSGAEMTAALGSGTITLNGVDIDVSTGGLDAAADRNSVVESINAKSGQTGVVAVDDGDAGGVRLEAENGRNIELNLNSGSNTLTSAATGLSEGVSYGGYTLVSEDSSEIKIEGGQGTGTGDISNAGLTAGTYSGREASVTSTSTFSALATSETQGTYTTANMGITAGTAVNATNNTFEISIDGAAFSTLTLDSTYDPSANGGTGTAGTYDDAADLAAAINHAITESDLAVNPQYTANAAFRNADTGAALVTASDDGNGGITFTSTTQGSDSSVVAKTGTGNMVLPTSTVETTGVDGDAAVEVISFNFLFDGTNSLETTGANLLEITTSAGASGDLTMGTTDYTDAQTFADDLNTAIGGDATIAGTVAARVSNDGLKVELYSTDSAITSIDLTAPSATPIVHSWEAEQAQHLTNGDAVLISPNDFFTTLDDADDIAINVDGGGALDLNFGNVAYDAYLVANPTATTAGSFAADLTAAETSSADAATFLQNVLDSQVAGAGITVSDVGGQLVLSSDSGGSVVITQGGGTAIEAGTVMLTANATSPEATEVLAATAGTATATGFNTADGTGDELAGTFMSSDPDGTGTAFEAQAAPLEISAATGNNTFDIAVDGAATPTTITVSDGSYSTMDELAAAITAGTTTSVANIAAADFSGVVIGDYDFSDTGSNEDLDFNLSLDSGATFNLTYTTDVDGLAAVTNVSEAQAQVVTDLQAALDTQYGANKVAVSFNNDELTFTSVAAGSTLTVTANNAAVGDNGSATASNGSNIPSFTVAASSDKQDLVFTSGTTGATSAADITNGTFAVEGGAVDGSLVTGGGAPNVLETGDLLINGSAIRGADAKDDNASDTTAISSDAAGSGIAVAAAINDSTDATGVTATVNATMMNGGGDNTALAQADVGSTGSITINGVETAGMSITGDEGRDRQTAIELINAKSGQTGVEATDNGESITLTAADGRNISVAIDNDLAANAAAGRDSSNFGNTIGLSAAENGVGEGDLTATGSTTYSNTAATTYSTVSLTSASSIEVASGVNGADELASLGLQAGTYGGGEDGQFLKDMDISTFEGATAALTAIDNAIGAIASQRADLGAIQNRMESTVSNLAITSENLSAANSRIQDADFAAETAELSRTQVLQQAGISILSQANQGPQQVLSLLG